MFSFLQILTRIFQAALSVFNIISLQQSSPHTLPPQEQKSIAVVVEAVQQVSGEQRVPR